MLAPGDKIKVVATYAGKIEVPIFRASYGDGETYGSGFLANNLFPAHYRHGDGIQGNGTSGSVTNFFARYCILSPFQRVVCEMGKVTAAQTSTVYMGNPSFIQGRSYLACTIGFGSYYERYYTRVYYPVTSTNEGNKDGNNCQLGNYPFFAGGGSFTFVTPFSYDLWPMLSVYGNKFGASMMYSIVDASYNGPCSYFAIGETGSSYKKPLDIDPLTYPPFLLGRDYGAVHYLTPPYEQNFLGNVYGSPLCARFQIKNLKDNLVNTTQFYSLNSHYLFEVGTGTRHKYLVGADTPYNAFDKDDFWYPRYRKNYPGHPFAIYLDDAVLDAAFNTFGSLKVHTSSCKGFCVTFHDGTKYRHLLLTTFKNKSFYANGAIEGDVMNWYEVEFHGGSAAGSRVLHDLENSLDTNTFSWTVDINGVFYVMNGSSQESTIHGNSFPLLIPMMRPKYPRFTPFHLECFPCLPVSFGRQ